MDTLLQDLRYAGRQLLRSPAFTAVAVGTLALGIGANTAIFSVVNGVLLRPLPFDEPDRLVAFVDAGSYKGMLLEFRERARSFERIESFTSYGFELSLTGDGEPVRVEATAVTAGLFSLLGAVPARGRTFLPEEEWTGGQRVVLLSYALWRQRFGADPAILGERIRLDGEGHTVVGVMPAGFGFPSGRTQLWVPFGIDRGDPLDLWAATAGTFVGRLRPAVSVERAGAEVRTLTPPMLELFPWRMPDDLWAEAAVAPLQEWMVGDARPALLVLLGAVGLVLLIACANVANLLLARATTRRKEMAIRVSLGARRRRIVRQVVTESLVLAAIAGGVGLFLAVWGVELLVAGLPADTPRLGEVALDGRALILTAGLTVATGLLFGTLPALRASQARVLAALKGGGHPGGSAGRRRFSGSLVAAEMALAVMVVIGAGLLIRSFWELGRVDPGFRSEGVVTATVAPPEFRYPDAAAKRVFHEGLLERLEALPGIERAAITDRLPFGRGAWGSVFTIEGRPDPATEGGDWPYADIAGVISAGYPTTMGIPLVEGRAFTDADRADAPPVGLVNEELARRYWPGESPVGQRIRSPAGAWTTIVGVVGDTKMTGLAEESAAALYRPLGQGGAGVVSVALRTSLAVGEIAPILREVVRSLDRDTPVEEIRGMPQLISASVADRRFTMLLLAAFAGVALLLGAIGIYGLLAWSVSERQREIGLRMALGARRGDVLRMVLGRGLVLAGIGTAIGVVGAAAGTRVLSSLLYGVGATDPGTFVAVPAFLLVVALLAAWFPARRATRVDPMVAMRTD
jgi:putative ABC transport system permease protein